MRYEDCISPDSYGLQIEPLDRFAAPNILPPNSRNVGERGEIATNDLENQELTMLALHLLQICLVHAPGILTSNNGIFVARQPLVHVEPKNAVGSHMSVNERRQCYSALLCPW